MFWMGIGIAGTCLSAQIAPWAVFAIWSPDPPPLMGILRQAVFYSVLIGYTAAAATLIVRGAAADLQSLRPLLRLNDRDFREMLLSLTQHRRSAIAAVTIPRLAFGLGFAEMNRHRLSHLFLTDTWTYDDVYATGAATATFLLTGPALVVIFGCVRAMQRAGRDHVRIDLLDLGSLAPLARSSLRTSLVLLVALAMVFFVGPTIRLGLPLLYLSIPIVLLSLLAFFAPSWGVSRRIRVEKRMELDRVRRAMLGDRGALGQSPLAEDAASLRRLDLLYYRNEIQSLRESPFDASALRRFGLYLLIPVVSWVGSAFVERLLDFGLN